MYSQALRIKRLCSSRASFENNVIRLESWFQSRAYPTELVYEQSNKAHEHILLQQGPTNRRSKKKYSTPVVVTYDPAFSGLDLITRIHFHVIQVNDNLRNVFQAISFVSFRNLKTFGRSLSRRKYLTLFQENVPLIRGRACKLCCHLTEANEFVCHYTAKYIK